MSPAKIAPSIGKIRGKLFLVATALIAVAAFVGLRETPGAPARLTAMAASPVAVSPSSDTHLESLQSAFAMSHVGALRDEADVEAKQVAPQAAAEQKARAAAPRPPAAPRASAPVAVAPIAQAPLPPAPLAATPAPPATKPSSLFGFVPTLPSAGKLVERVASLGDSITSLVRWR